MQEKPLFFEGNPPANRGFLLIFVENASGMPDIQEQAGATRLKGLYSAARIASTSSSVEPQLITSLITERVSS